MRLFRKKTKQSTPTQYIRDPFAAVPLQPDCVEMKYDSLGQVHLRLSVSPTGMKKRIANWLGYDYTKKLQLDEFGSFFYEQIDGQTPLAVIVTRMTLKFDKTREELEGPVILFTKKLMTLHMIALIIPKP